MIVLMASQSSYHASILHSKFSGISVLPGVSTRFLYSSTNLEHWNNKCSGPLETYRSLDHHFSWWFNLNMPSMPCEKLGEIVTELLMFNLQPFPMSGIDLYSHCPLWSVLPSISAFFGCSKGKGKDWIDVICIYLKVTINASFKTVLKAEQSLLHSVNNTCPQRWLKAGWKHPPTFGIIPTRTRVLKTIS